MDCGGEKARYLRKITGNIEVLSEPSTRWAGNLLDEKSIWARPTNLLDKKKSSKRERGRNV